MSCICVSSITVSPSKKEMPIGGSFFASVTVSPANATDKSVCWSSSDSNVATVNPDNGLVTARSTGMAVITATTKDGSKKSDYCTVVVKNPILVDSVCLDFTSRTVSPGTSFTLEATVCPVNAANRSVCWSSSDTSVATVNPDSGLVRAIKPGTAVVMATAKDGSGKRDCCTITVNNDTLVESVRLNFSSRIVTPGTSFTLEATVCPLNAANRSVCWSSSNTSVATVNPDSGLIISRSIGTASITATAKDGSGKKDCCTVTVKNSIPVSSVCLNISSRTLNPDTCFTLRATVCPENATDRSICWSSSSTNVATVDADSGVVTAKAAGTAVITATATDGSGKADCCTVTVTEDTLSTNVWVGPLNMQLDLYANRSAYAYATVLPTCAANRGVSWCSSDTNVATVNPNTGLVYAQGVGSAVIMAVANDGSGAHDTCCVRVRDVDVTGQSPDELLPNNKLLLLNHLIYLSGVWSGDNTRVADAVKYLLDTGLDRIFREEGSYPAEMSRSEWEAVLHLIRADPALSDLRIEHPVDNENTGMRVAAFVDGEGNAYVVFRGTSSLAYEWYDNGMGGYMSDTPCQQESLDYIENTLGYYANGNYVGDSQKPYKTLTVSGHSKGGNRAQYVTITSCIVDKCVSFDGQGFSMEFLEKYKDEVLKRSDKIISISCEYDFVNCLFYPLPIPVENRIYLAAPYLSVGNFPKYHSPYVMIGSSGQFYRKADASLITKQSGPFKPWPRMLFRLKENKRYRRQ